MEYPNRSVTSGMLVCSLMTVVSGVRGQPSTASAPARLAQTRPFDYGEHVVTAPISPRVNVILGNLIEDCAIVDGQWDRHQGDPGCVEMFSALFGYRAGLRRGREDVVAIGRAAAENEFGRIFGIVGGLLSGKKLDLSKLAGAPALLVSGTTGRDPRHYAVLTAALAWFRGRMDDYDLDVVQKVGVAYLLAESYRYDPRGKAGWIEQARTVADQIGERPSDRCFRAFAWSTIARSTGEAVDRELAEQMALSLVPQFTRTKAGLEFAGPYSDCLSVHLALGEAMADLAILDPGGPWYRRGVELLEYIYSDAYFNGRFLAHDRVEGRQAATFCTGCNYHALYLADRICGDTLKLDPVPPLRVVRAERRRKSGLGSVALRACER